VLKPYSSDNVVFVDMWICIPSFAAVAKLLCIIRFVRRLEYNGAALREDIATIRRLIVPLAKEVVKNQHERLDVWTQSNVTRDDNPDFKEKLVLFYQRQSRAGNINCMILNDSFPSKVILGSHIYKQATHGKGLEEFGLERQCIYNERNGLLLYYWIEKAFDRKDLCILYNSLTKSYSLKVLNPKLAEEYVVKQEHVNYCRRQTASLKFKDIDGYLLQLPPNVYPYRRLLSWHAKCSVRCALFENWITKETKESFQTFFELSEGATQPEELDLSGLLSPQSQQSISNLLSPQHGGSSYDEHFDKKQRLNDGGT
jgi:hypothetical protein